MKRFLMMLVIVTMFFCVNIAFAQKQTSIRPATVYKQAGITFVSPDQPGWTLLKSNKLETIFEKRDQDAVSNASVKTIHTEPFATNQDRLASFEAMKKEELSSLNRDSIHFNYVRFKGLTCMEYDGIFKLQETPPSKLEDFHIKGYLCQHPTVENSAIQIEFTNYSKTRDFTEEFISLSDNFFEKAIFSAAAAKTKSPNSK